MAIASVFLSFRALSVNANPAPQMVVPTGIQLPKELLGQVIPTSNPYIPHRPENMPPSPSASVEPQKKTAYDFVMRDFLIVLGAVLGFIGLIIFILMIWRFIKGDPDLTKQWEKEQVDLARRTSQGVEKHKKLWLLKKKKKGKKMTKEEKEAEEMRIQFQSD